MVSGVRLGYAVHGDRRSLEERWHLTAAQLRSVGGRELPPICEENLVAMRAEIARMTEPAAIEAPMLREARNEFYNLRRRYHAAWCSIRDLQSKISAAARDPIHRLLCDIPHDWSFTFDQISLAVGSAPVFKSVPDAKEAIFDFMPRVLAIEGRKAQLVAALAFENQAPEQVNRHLILVLAKRLAALEQEVEVLRSEQPKRRKSKAA
jgi:hypothetical protein